MSPAPDWIQAIRSMLRTELVWDSNELREDDKHSKCAPVKIHRSGQCLFVCFNNKVDDVRVQDRLFPLFKQIDGLGRMCDYWIFYEHTPRNSPPIRYVFLVELKSDKIQGIEQLENAQMLAEYFLAMVSHHQRGDYADVKFRGLVFSSSRARKVGLQPGKVPFQSYGRRGLEVAVVRDEATHYLPMFCD